MKAMKIIVGVLDVALDMACVAAAIWRGPEPQLYESWDASVVRHGLTLSKRVRRDVLGQVER